MVNKVELSDLMIRTYEPADEAQVIDLWQRCNLVVPWNDPQRDILLKLQFQPELLFAGTIHNRVVATLMAGYEGHRGWLNYLAVEPDLQRQGIGRRMVHHAEVELEKLGCPKINLMVRGTNTAVIEFYERLGYQREERVNLGKRL